MLRILIVDDEELIRDGVALKIQRLVPRARIIGKAEDAEEAMEMIKSFNPNVIITDIRMPGLDGLKFIEQVRKLSSNIKFVLISGYQEFEYARKGIELGVEDYLLKPIENQKLKNTLDRLEKKIKEEINLKKHLQELSYKANNSIEILKVKYLNDAINHTGEFDMEFTIKALERLEIIFEKPIYTVATILLKNIDNLPCFEGRQNISLAKFAIKNIAQEILFNLGTVVAFENTKRDNQIAVIINHNSMDNDNIITQCNSIVDKLDEVLSLFAVIGLGRSYDNINFLQNSYLESYSAAMQSIALSGNKVIHINSVPDSNLVTFFIPENERLLLLSYINSRDTEKASEFIDKIFTTIKNYSLSYANIKALCIDIIIMLGRTVKDSGGTWENIFEHNIFSDEHISQYTTLEQLNTWLKKCIASICSYLFDLRKSDGKKAITEIRKYIQDYYYTNINFNQLASKYFMNPSYLSQLFKIETGERYIDYLTWIRVQKAKELLLKTPLKVYEIASMVGYNDPDYFSKIFAKNVGFTPSRFRKKAKT